MKEVPNSESTIVFQDVKILIQERYRTEWSLNSPQFHVKLECKEREPFWWNSSL